MQQKKPEDFVVATGNAYSVKQFIQECAKVLKMKIFWKGKGINEKAYNKKNQCVIEINKKYFRPAEVDSLVGNYKKAKKILKWKPRISFRSLVNEMVDSDLRLIK